jgi:hypothetical protein
MIADEFLISVNTACIGSHWFNKRSVEPFASISSMVPLFLEGRFFFGAILTP